ncbi:hypothetical protein BDC45DRAFT_602754 [Circinella umbellata]|nr:hypothetical protein BDC45DRAFT_602754 [Circinella umbellata]
MYKEDESSANLDTIRGKEDKELIAFDSSKLANSSAISLVGSLRFCNKNQEISGVENPEERFSFGFCAPWQKQLLLSTAGKFISLDATHDVSQYSNGVMYTMVIRHPIVGRKSYLHSIQEEMNKDESDYPDDSDEYSD